MKKAPSNAALVRQVVALCEAYGRRPATVDEARLLRHLPAAAMPAAIAA
jgi:3-keto-5-aminohexanoate cleavage enzyme